MLVLVLSLCFIIVQKYFSILLFTFSFDAKAVDTASNESSCNLVTCTLTSEFCSISLVPRVTFGAPGACICPLYVASTLAHALFFTIPP